MKWSTAVPMSPTENLAQPRKFISDPFCHCNHHHCHHHHNHHHPHQDQHQQVKASSARRNWEAFTFTFTGEEEDCEKLMGSPMVARNNPSESYQLVGLRSWG